MILSILSLGRESQLATASTNMNALRSHPQRLFPTVVHELLLILTISNRILRLGKNDGRSLSPIYVRITAIRAFICGSERVTTRFISLLSSVCREDKSNRTGN